MRSVPRSGRLAVLLAAAVLGLLSSLLAACGDRSRLIPAQAATELDNDLEKASNAVADGHCQQALRYVDDAINSANDLGESVDPRLRQNLDGGLAHVSRRIAEDCRRTTTTPTTTTPTETTPPPTTTTPPTPTQTTTEHTTPPPTPTTPPSPPSNSGGTGSGGTGGHGGGGGNSGGGDGSGGTSGGTSAGGGSG